MNLSLLELLRGDASIDAFVRALDALSPDAREAFATDLGRADQARLFEKAGDAPPIRLSHYVPDELPPLTPVHHAGRNTVFTIPYFKRFQKRFARGPEGGVMGYNASNAWFITPGYFVAVETDGNALWEPRGGVVIDYFRVPEGEVPAMWPRVRPNSEGLQRLVYHQTRDFMRSVGTHMSIGRAACEDKKGDRLLDYWFTLCRREPSGLAIQGNKR